MGGAAGGCIAHILSCLLEIVPSSMFTACIYFKLSVAVVLYSQPGRNNRGIAIYICHNINLSLVFVF